MGKHSKAAKYAEEAIALLQSEYGHGLKKQTSDGKSLDVVFATQARGFFNLGVELEFLKLFDESLAAYDESLRICKKLGHDDDFVAYVKVSNY